MTGYVLAFGQCISCKRVFGFNPILVPSIRIDGEREPICEACITKANPQRIRNGLPPVIPDPDAYGACPENML
jgi:hypothetical protein